MGRCGPGRQAGAHLKIGDDPLQVIVPLERTQINLVPPLFQGLGSPWHWSSRPALRWRGGGGGGFGRGGLLVLANHALQDGSVGLNVLQQNLEKENEAIIFVSLWKRNKCFETFLK